MIMNEFNFIYAFIITFILTSLLVKYPISLSFPTNRGLHNQPIATSGGIAIFFGISSILFFEFDIDILNLLILFGVIMLVGSIDDKINLSILIRFIVQILLLIIFISLYPSSFVHNLFTILIFVIISTYFINIFNFMDGIDLLASLQTIFTLASLLIIFYEVLMVIPYLYEIITFTISSLLSFIIFNKSPAKIFLGNSGSYLLGFMLLSIFYFIIGDNIYNIYSILIIFTIFLCDSTYTLKARFITHLFSSKHQSIYKRIYESLSILSSPHKTHLYQKLAQKFISHRRVNLYLMSYNIFWCFPLALISSKFAEYSILTLILSYIPYIIWCYSNRAGVLIDNDQYN